MSTAITRSTANSGEIIREGFDGSSIERRGEQSSTALAAAAQAEVQARYLVALQRPRSMDDVRVRLLRECERPGFADRAIYSLPRGDKPGRITGAHNRIEGLTVRFAEAAIRLSGNIMQQTRVVYDDDFKRQINVSVSDLETNAVYSTDLLVDKTTERKNDNGRVVLAKRTNSAGALIYIVQATDEELAQKIANLVSKTFRTLGLRLVPADILEECEDRIIDTQRRKDATDPDAARKKISDAFAKLGVLPSDLNQYLRHDVASCSPAEIADMRALHNAIRDGETTWAQAISDKDTPTEGETPKTSRAAGLADKIKANKADRKDPEVVADPQAREPG